MLVALNFFFKRNYQDSGWTILVYLILAGDMLIEIIELLKDLSYDFDVILS